MPKRSSRLKKDRLVSSSPLSKKQKINHDVTPSGTDEQPMSTGVNDELPIELPTRHVGTNDELPIELPHESTSPESSSPSDSGIDSDSSTGCITLPIDNDIPQIDNNVLTVIKLSDEQESIAAEVVLMNNVQVIAKAGCGKTSTSIEIAKRFYEKHNKRTLILTYNARLKEETRSRIKHLTMNYAVECHSYHAAVLQFYLKNADNGNSSSASDQWFFDALRIDTPVRSLDKFGLLIIDEAQDMTENHYRFVCHMLSHFPSPPVMLLLGDPFQRIFGYNGADDKYLLRPHYYFGAYVRSVPFITKHMTICWRITHEMAEWINTNLNPNSLQRTYPEWWAKHGDTISALWGTGVHANPMRPPSPDSVVYFNGKYVDKAALRHIRELFTVFPNDDVVVMAKSVKGNSPIDKIVDTFGKEQNENWTVWMAESEGVTERECIIKGKRVASTIHKFKGLERKAVFFCGLDSYLEKYNSADTPLNHFNLAYVACTRAQDKLVIQATTVGRGRSGNEEYATIRNNGVDHEYDLSPCDVTSLISYVPYDELLNNQNALFNTSQDFKMEDGFNFSDNDRIIPGREPGTAEDLSAFIGIAVMEKIQFMLTGTLVRILVNDRRPFDNEMNDWYDMHTKPESFTWQDYLLRAIAHETYKLKYKHWWRQLKPNLHLVNESLLDRSVDNALQALYATAKRWVDQCPQRECCQGNQCCQSDQCCQHQVPHIITTKEMIDHLRPLVQFEVPLTQHIPHSWFSDRYLCISGRADIIITDQYSPRRKLVVELKVSNALKLDHLLQVQMYASCLRSHVGFMLDDDKPCGAIGAAVIIANKGECHWVEFKMPKTTPKSVEEEFIYRMAARKVGCGWDVARTDLCAI